MINTTEILADDNNCQIVVNYDYEKTDGYLEEPENIASYVSATVYTVLNIVEVVIGGVGVDITRQLNDKQKELIISKLNY
jgi:hypothetical protein